MGKDLLQNNHQAPKAPFLPISQQKLPNRTRGTARQPLPASEQKSSLLESRAYSARGLNYHTKALVDADIFTIMGSIYAEVARYDSAVTAKQFDLAEQAAARAQEIMDYSQSLKQINHAQKLEIKKFNDVFDQQAKQIKKSELDNYLLPFAIQARLRQFS